jgi:hypothetical protein
MSERLRRWVEAIKILAVDPTVKVLCPENLDEYLDVFDVPFSQDSDLIERYLVCPKCGTYNVARMHRPKDGVTD